MTSGLAVFVNSYGVHAIAQPSVYTTAKNVVAAVLLGGAALVGRRFRKNRGDATALGRFVTTPGRSAHPTLGAVLALAFVGIVGGGLAFVLFFDGLAETAAAPAAFWHDTLLVWVGVLAIPLLHERIRWLNLAAVGLLILGQVAVSGGTGHLAADRGEVLVLGATVLWSLETVVAKRLLRQISSATVAVVRMGVGGATLIVDLAATGDLRSLASLDAGQIGWALLTGLLLAVYVGTWMTALARARALDVASVLVGGALITWVLEALAGSAPLGVDALGLVAVAGGTGAVLWTNRSRARSVGVGTARS